MSALWWTLRFWFCWRWIAGFNGGWQLARACYEAEQMHNLEQTPAEAVRSELECWTE